MEDRHDVIIVGARCAGATLAALLARKGVRVLLLEAAPRGTDMPMSSHFIQTRGMDVLDGLGIGDRVRAVTPATRHFRLALDDESISARFPEGRSGYCIRRSVIDPWLQATAVEAGAELVDRHKVTNLLRDGERVTGVVARGPSGTKEFRAPLVVGADGMYSTIAKLTEAPEYLVTAQGSRAGYWGYFPAPSKWELPWDATLEHRGNDVRYVFRCDGDLVALIYMGEREEIHRWGRATARNFSRPSRVPRPQGGSVRERSPSGTCSGS